MKDDQQTIPCKYCNEQTPMLGTKLCDPCWELERCIYASPEMARKILGQFDREHITHMAEQFPPRRPATKIEVEAMGAICNLQDELFEAREVIRGLLTDLSPYTREKAVKFLKQHKQSDSQEE